MGARYRRVMRHRGHPKAVIAVAHALLRTIYHILASGQEYHNLGPDYFERRETDRVRQRAVRTLGRLGFRATIEAAASVVCLSTRNGQSCKRKERSHVALYWPPALLR